MKLASSVSWSIFMPRYLERLRLANLFWWASLALYSRLVTWPRFNSRRMVLVLQPTSLAISACVSLRRLRDAIRCLSSFVSWLYICPIYLLSLAEKSGQFKLQFLLLLASVSEWLLGLLPTGERSSKRQKNRASALTNSKNQTKSSSLSSCRQLITISSRHLAQALHICPYGLHFLHYVIQSCSRSTRQLSLSWRH